jgi:hypothetical protein
MRNKFCKASWLDANIALCLPRLTTYTHTHTHTHMLNNSATFAIACDVTALLVLKQLPLFM